MVNLCQVTYYSPELTDEVEMRKILIILCLSALLSFSAFASPVGKEIPFKKNLFAGKVNFRIDSRSNILILFLVVFLQFIRNV